MEEGPINISIRGRNRDLSIVLFLDKTFYLAGKLWKTHDVRKEVGWSKEQ